jgi:hypothetical protein
MTTHHLSRPSIHAMIKQLSSFAQNIKKCANVHVVRVRIPRSIHKDNQGGKRHRSKLHQNIEPKIGIVVGMILSE